MQNNIYLRNEPLLYFQINQENLLSAKYSLKIGKNLIFQKSQLYKLFWNVASENKTRVLLHGNINPSQYSFSHDLLSANQKQERNVYGKETSSIN
jgi:hypothetical protein